MGLTDTKGSGKVIAIGYAWISVGERLPDENGQYLVAYRIASDLEYRISTSGFDAAGEYWVFSRTVYAHNGTITHWMPLPQPPGG